MRFPWFLPGPLPSNLILRITTPLIHLPAHAMDARRREVASGTSPGRDLPAIISWRSPCGHGALCSDIPPLQVAGVRPQDLRRPPMGAGVELPAVPRHRGDCMRAFIGCKPPPSLFLFYTPLSSVPLGSPCCRSAVKYWSPTLRLLLAPPPSLRRLALYLQHHSSTRCIAAGRMCIAFPLLPRRDCITPHAADCMSTSNPLSSSLCIFAPHTRRSCSPHHSYVYLMHPCHAVMGGPPSRVSCPPSQFVPKNA